MRWCSLRAVVCAGAAAWLAGPSRLAAQSFTLGLAAASLPCDRIDDRSTWFECVLGSSATDPPVDGWAIAIESCGEGRLAELSLAGTAGEPALSGGFVHNEIVTAAGREGAVSLVALSTSELRTLPPGPSQALLQVRVEAALGQATCLQLVDGLKSSAGEVSNIVQSRSRAFRPTMAPRPLTLRNHGAAVPHVGFAAESVLSAVPYEGILGGRTAVAERVLPITERGDAEAHLYPCLILEEGLAGERGSVQGWMISLAIDGDAELVRIGSDGTAAEMAIVEEGFRIAEEVDPALNGGTRGLISAIILSFIQPITLPPVGTYALLDMYLRLGGAPCPAPCPTTVSFRDGLRVRGPPPAENSATMDGFAVRPCNVHQARVALRASADDARFLRGDANGDGGFNIADAIFVLTELFRGGPVSGCRDGEDANADLTIDLSDAIAILEYLFRRGTPPPPPFPECGVRKVGTPRLGCREAHAACP